MDVWLSFILNIYIYVHILVQLSAWANEPSFGSWNGQSKNDNLSKSLWVFQTLPEPQEGIV